MRPYIGKNVSRLLKGKGLGHKSFRVIFFLKMKTITFPLSKKKSPKVANLPLADETLCLSF